MNDAWVDGWLNLRSSNRYLLHRSPRLYEAQTSPGQGTGTWVFSENIMTTLHYRGQAYATRKPSDVKSCIELTYRHEHYNTCRELVRAEMQEHPSLTYRGIAYSKWLTLKCVELVISCILLPIANDCRLFYCCRYGQILIICPRRFCNLLFYIDLSPIYSFLSVWRDHRLLSWSDPHPCCSK